MPSRTGPTPGPARTWRATLPPIANSSSPLKGSLAAWKAERRARIEDKGFIKVDISDLKVQIQGNRATATFRQRYTADNYQSNDRKTLELQREGDKWLITREFTSP